MFGKSLVHLQNLQYFYFVVIIGIERLISWEVAQIDTRMANLQQSLIISLPC